MTKKEKKVFVTCEECGVDVRDINVLEHKAKAHGDQKAKETIEYIEKIKSLFTREGVRTFVEEKKRMLKPVEENKQEMDQFLKGCEQELRTMSMLIQSGNPTGGMVSRKGVEDSFDTDVDEMIKTIGDSDETKERKDLLQSLKKLKGKTLFESLKNIQEQKIEKEKKQELALTMISLYPSFAALVWKKTYGRVCKDCLMNDYKKLACEKGDFWCVHDLYFNFVHEVISRKIIEQVIEGKLEDLEKTIDSQVSGMNINFGEEKKENKN